MTEETEVAWPATTKFNVANLTVYSQISILGEIEVQKKPCLFKNDQDLKTKIKELVVESGISCLDCCY